MYYHHPRLCCIVYAKRLRSEGVEPPTVGSGIQRSTTELTPQCWFIITGLTTISYSVQLEIVAQPGFHMTSTHIRLHSCQHPTWPRCLSITELFIILLYLLVAPNPRYVSYYCSVCHFVCENGHFRFLISIHNMATWRTWQFLPRLIPPRWSSILYHEIMYSDYEGALTCFEQVYPEDHLVK